MIFHNLRIAAKSLRRNTTLTVLIISGIALGIAVATTFAAFRHAFAKHPIPQKAETLRYVRLDSWDPLKPYPGNDPTQPPTQITYRDMRGIMQSKIHIRQSGMFVSNMYVYPDPKISRPFRELVRLCFGDFFPMFDVPFRYGSGWDARADAGPEAVAVPDHLVAGLPEQRPRALRRGQKPRERIFVRPAIRRRQRGVAAPRDLGDIVGRRR